MFVIVDLRTVVRR